MCHQHEADARQVSSSRTPAGLLQKLTAGKAAMMPARMPLGRFPAVLFLCAAAAARAAAVSLGSDSGFHWTPAKVILAVFLFFLAGLCEIGGGWLVWQVKIDQCHLPSFQICLLCRHSAQKESTRAVIREEPEFLVFPAGPGSQGGEAGLLGDCRSAGADRLWLCAHSAADLQLWQNLCRCKQPPLRCSHMLAEPEVTAARIQKRSAKRVNSSVNKMHGLTVQCTAASLSY